MLARVLTLIVSTALAPCFASVVYTFTGETGITGTPFNISFQYTVPDFITVDTTVPAASLDACATGFEACSQVSFSPVSIHDAGSAHIEFFTTTTSSLGFFNLGSLAAAGVYPTTFGVASGTLTVEQTAAIPEPASGALVLSALAGLAMLRRRRK